jgi:hypothetical protein
MKKNFIKRFSFFVLVPVLLLSCHKFEFNPLQTEDSHSPTELNAKNIAKLRATEATSDDTVTILFTGDSQRFYNKLDDLVQVINRNSKIDFLLLDGDISDFGLLQEFIRIVQQLDKLNIPYISVIGNHDLTSRGSEVYTKMFGPKNFSFTYKDYKFLCHDDCSREYNFPGNVPDLNWLSNEIQNSSASWFVGASHIPPWSEDFDQSMVKPYADLFGATPGFILSLHGHLVAPYAPDAKYFNNDSVLYLVSSDVESNSCYLLKLINGTIIKQMITY